jgi:seryl-tRNA synthetase
MTTLHRVVLDAPVPIDLVTAVGDKLAYASDHVRAAELCDDRASVTFRLDDDGELTGATSRIRDLVAGLVRGFRTIPQDIVWRHPVTPRHRAPVWDELVADGALMSTGPGCVALLGDAFRIAAALDRQFAALGRALGAVDHQYPVLISRETMERCDYFSSFPHHITFAPHLREDVSTITEVAQAGRDARGDVIRGALASPSHLLSPTVCYHTYAWLADKPLTAPTVVTAINRCFRWEAANFATAERLWDFSMREVIFAGEPAWIEDQRRAVIAAVQKIVDRLALDAWIETANDPFFVTQFAAKRYYQLITQAKLELRLSLPYAGTSLAAASFNLHADFFGRAYGIGRAATGEGFASTGCVGFGLERWVWALFAQHGPRLTDWPAAVTRALEL